MIKYVFRDDEQPVILKGRRDADPQVIGDELEKIRLAAGGELRPEAVVDAAKAAKHPLHPHFEWNDVLAANQHRLAQARTLIRIVRVVGEEDGEMPKMAFLSIAGPGGRSYRAVGDVIRSQALQDALLAAADRDLKAWEERYREIKDVCQLVTAARAKLAAKRKRAASKQETRASA